MMVTWIASHLLFSGYRHYIYRTVGSAKFAAVEGYASFGECKQCMILADADIAARVEFRTALTHENIARNGNFATELLDAETTAG